MASFIFPVVTICGSMRFYDQMLQVAEELTASGFIVLMPFIYHNNGVKTPDDAFAQMLDRMHLRKIDMSSEIIVCTGFSGYVGESTSREIEYARSNDKVVTYR